VTVGFTHEELYEFYKHLETIQSQLDGLHWIISYLHCILFMWKSDFVVQKNTKNILDIFMYMYIKTACCVYCISGNREKYKH
jgi:hypothetical protein